MVAEADQKANLKKVLQRREVPDLGRGRGRREVKKAGASAPWRPQTRMGQSENAYLPGPWGQGQSLKAGAFSKEHLALPKTSRSRQGDYSLAEATRTVERPRSSPAWPEAASGSARACCIRLRAAAGAPPRPACLCRALAGSGSRARRDWWCGGCSGPQVTSRRGVGAEREGSSSGELRRRPWSPK